MDWKDLVYASHYQTAVAIKEELDKGHLEESEEGLEELIEALGRSEERALRSQLTRLMIHIIKWAIQPQHRSRSWLATIVNARIEIMALLEDEPGLQPKIQKLWQKCFQAALQLAQTETGIKPTISELSWEEVFEEEFPLEEDR